MPLGVGQYLVAWGHNTGTLIGGWNSDVWAARVTGEGVPLEDHLLVSASLSNLQPQAVAADEGRGSYTVVWQSYDSFTNSYVYRREVSSSGVMIGPATWVGGSNAWDMDIANGGRGDYLVAFNDRLVGAQEDQIWASPVAYWLFLPLTRR